MTPATAQGWRKALRGLMQHCLKLELVREDVTHSASDCGRFGPMVITLGAKRKSRNSRLRIRSAVKRVWPWRSAYIARSGAGTA
jgi:hypothetical protein